MTSPAVPVQSKPSPFVQSSKRVNTMKATTYQMSITDASASIMKLMKVAGGRTFAQINKAIPQAENILLDALQMLKETKQIEEGMRGDKTYYRLCKKRRSVGNALKDMGCDSIEQCDTCIIGGPAITVTTTSTTNVPLSSYVPDEAVMSALEAATEGKGFVKPLSYDELEFAFHFAERREEKLAHIIEREYGCVGEAKFAHLWRDDQNAGRVLREYITAVRERSEYEVMYQRRREAI